MIIFTGIAGETDSFLYDCLSKLGYNPEGLKINRNVEGKPNIEGYKGYVSVSHSDEIIIAAFSDHCLGIDIERIKQRNYFAIASRYFTKEEAEIIKIEGEKSFYSLFTMKEAYYKLRGTKDWLKITREEIIREGIAIFQSEYVEGYILTALCTAEEKIVKA
jgi:phosphopantetheinyl transferase